MEIFIEKNYKVSIAGQTWEFDEIKFSRDAEGRARLPLEETVKINRSIANSICSTDASLTGEEFEFLCRLSRTSYAETAKRLKTDASTPTKWVAKGTVPPLESEVIKIYIWNKIFADLLSAELDRASRSEGAEALAKMGDKAIEKKWADSPKRAA